MMNIKSITEVRQGYNHITRYLECQDYALCDTTNQDATILVLSDGHGSAKYFRSASGSRIACEVALDTLKIFIREFDINTMLPNYSGKMEKGGSEGDKTMPKDANLDKIFRRLGAAIIYRWVNRVSENWVQNPPTNEEMKRLNSDEIRFYKDADTHTIVKAYGCTLQLAVRTSAYWFALHIGDGKIVAVKNNGDIYEPVPWDPACHDTTTTSLCEMDPGRVRYAFGTYLSDVGAIFLASDGMDDSFANFEELASVYGVNVLSEIHFNHWEAFAGKLGRFLDSISRSRSGDDMSLACWVDLDALPSMLPEILNKDKQRINNQISYLKREIQRLEQEERSYQEQLDNISSALNLGRDINTEFDTFIENIWAMLSNVKREVVDLFKKFNIGLPKMDSNISKGLEAMDSESIRLGIEKKVRTEKIEKYKKMIINSERELKSIEEKIKTLLQPSPEAAPSPEPESSITKQPQPEPSTSNVETVHSGTLNIIPVDGPGDDSNNSGHNEDLTLFK